jgi:long-chain fatty acid transport protein
MNMRRIIFLCMALVFCCGITDHTFAQTFGVELNNNVMPASGGMGGVSIARPQDFLSGINGNTATLTQFKGTQFTFSGAWAEATFNQTQTANIPVIGQPIVTPFSAKNSAPGSAVANIGVTQELSELGLPATIGIGFVTTSGALTNYTHVPESGGTGTGLFVFNLPVSLGVDLTDRWSVGTSVALGIGIYDAPFVGVSNMVMDYGLRASFGTNYQLNDCNSIGGYYQTKQNFDFQNGFIINPGLGQIPFDVAVDMPENLGFGIANTALMDGRLLLGADLLYKLWENTDTFGVLYENQFALQLGTQYSIGRYRLRSGYTWAQDPINDSPGPNIGGVVQPDIRAIRHVQGLLAVTSEHRLSLGLGVVDVLPGVDFDMMGGGMFLDEKQLGATTNTSIESYWLGAGVTWRFRRGSCCPTSAPDSWSSN